MAGTVHCFAISAAVIAKITSRVVASNRNRGRTYVQLSFINIWSTFLFFTRHFYGNRRAINLNFSFLFVKKHATRCIEKTRKFLLFLLRRNIEKRYFIHWNSCSFFGEFFFFFLIATPRWYLFQFICFVVLFCKVVEKKFFAIFTKKKEKCKKNSSNS